MTHINDFIDREDLTDALNEGLVNTQTSPDGQFVIYNYSAAAQFSRTWNSATLNCRGLITDLNGNVVARCLKKFFNYTEVNLPMFTLSQVPLVYDKADGSLGIIYKTDDGYKVATRGSFQSVQAEWATKWLNHNMPDLVVPDGQTALVEIIFPENRIVVDYKGWEGLTLLAVIDNATGADVPLWEVDWWAGDVVKQYTGLRGIDDAYAMATSHDFDASEGLVLCWLRPGEPSVRCKIKNPEYLRLHKLITQCSSVTIWEALSKRQSLTELLEAVPDEFYDWVRSTVDRLNFMYYGIARKAVADFQEITATVGTESRKDFAAAAKKTQYPGLVFSLLDGKSIEEQVWKMVRPEYERPFLNGD